MRRRFLVRVTLALLCLLTLVGVALADTGGSMGGGDWSGGGGGGGGGDYSSSSNDYSSSSNSGGYSYDSSGDDYSSSSSGNFGGCTGVGFGIVILIVWAIVQAVEKSRFESGRAAMIYDAAMSPAMGPTIDVGVLRVVIDGRARKFVQTELDRIAKSASTATAEGRQAMLREVTLLLRRVHDAWVYGGAVNEPMMAKSSGKSAFDRHVDDARSRFREETVRNAQGVIATREASENIPRSAEGAGVILVSIVLATKTELMTVTRIGNGAELRSALEAASYRDANDLIAIEIIWQPSKDEDRLSSIELEAKYPHPQIIPITNALVGKIFCSYCSGPFPAELLTCPHCGAPAPGHESSTTA